MVEAGCRATDSSFSQGAKDTASVSDKGGDGSVLADASTHARVESAVAMTGQRQELLGSVGAIEQTGGGAKEVAGFSTGDRVQTLFGDAGTVRAH